KDPFQTRRSRAFAGIAGLHCGKRLLGRRIARLHFGCDFSYAARRVGEGYCGTSGKTALRAGWSTRLGLAERNLRQEARRKDQGGRGRGVGGPEVDLAEILCRQGGVK